MWNGFSAGSCRDSLPGRRRTLDGLKLRLTADRARPGPGGRGMWYLNCERKRRRELRGPPRRSEAPGGDDSRSWALFWKGPGNWGADFGAQRGGQFTKAAQVPTLKRRCTGSLAVPAHCMCSQQQVVAPFSVFLSWSFDPSEGGRGPGGLDTTSLGMAAAAGLQVSFSKTLPDDQKRVGAMLLGSRQSPTDRSLAA